MVGCAGRAFFLAVKLFLMVIVTAMLLFQIPELRYDLGPKTPVTISASDELSLERYGEATFAVVHGQPDLERAASFAKHGVRYSYFLLKGYDGKLVVRTAEQVTEEWEAIDRHVGRLRRFGNMPFRRSVRAGFRQLFDAGIAEDALFLARDDVPRLSGWSIGATIFACTLWLVLGFFFFIFPLVRRKGTRAA